MPIKYCKCRFCPWKRAYGYKRDGKFISFDKAFKILRYHIEDKHPKEFEEIEKKLDNDYPYQKGVKNDNAR